MDSTLNKPYLVPILFVVMLGVGLTTTISYFYTKRSVEELSLAQMSQALMLLNKEVTDKIRGIESDAILWSQEEVFRLALSEGYLGRSARVAAEKRLAERALYNEYDRVFLALPDGEVVAASATGMVGAINVADREYFKRTMHGNLAMETLSAGKYSGQPVLVVSAPILSQSTVLGVMVLVMDIPRVSRELLDGVRVGQTGGAFLLDMNDSVLATPSWKSEGQFSPAPSEAKSLRASLSGQAVHYFGGQTERMALSVNNAKAGWLLVLEADSAELLRPAAKLAALNGAISLAVLGLVGVALWVLRNAISNLRDSEARYRILTETIPVGIATFDRRGNPEYINQRALDLLGLDTDDPGTGQPWTGRFETREGHPLPFEDLPMAKALAGIKPVQPRTAWYRRPQGGRSILFLGAAPLRSEGGTGSKAVAVIEDITERTRIQEMMVQTEKMLSVGGLAAGMAHEINNPLASILQAVQVLNRRMDPALPANAAAAKSVGIDLDAMRAYMRERELDGFLEGIRDAGQRAAKIVKNMLGFARKSGGDYLECDIAELLDRTVELAAGDYDLKKHFDFKKIEIVRDYEPDLGMVECQSMEIEQVFFNIIKNAAQALKETSQEHSLPRITLRTRAEGNLAVVEIEDNGPGMTEDVRKRVFEPFFTTKSIGVGTGLGLSVAYFIVSENHKGSIVLDSSPGKGARFRIKLPFKHLT
ncbi:MAG: PAS domain S-box protein [Desulfovibrio sp.]|nr:PAS domain S-box protein [Desulfovibrio sp.]MBI4961051.1 PAS domain S-box protein [Desulfovibrio sp.]